MTPSVFWGHCKLPFRPKSPMSLTWTCNQLTKSGNWLASDQKWKGDTWWDLQKLSHACLSKSKMWSCIIFFKKNKSIMSNCHVNFQSNKKVHICVVPMMLYLRQRSFSFCCRTSFSLHETFSVHWSFWFIHCRRHYRLMQFQIQLSLDTTEVRVEARCKLGNVKNIFEKPGLAMLQS